MGFLAFEDFIAGEVRRFGDYEFTADEIITFASVYDAQPFHVDAEKGRAHGFGGLIASGWHTCSALMRMNVDHWLLETTGIAGVGVEENRWLKPVRPGDRLSAEMTTLEKIDLRSRPDAGIIKFAISLSNQGGKEVMAQKCSMLFGRHRPLSEEAPVQSSKPPRLEPPARIDDRLAALPDDYARARVGAYAELGATVFTPESIRDYAEKYDPLPFHLRDDVADAHLFDGLSAAGFHIGCCWMQHMIAARQRLAGGADLPSRLSPGFENLVWRKPVMAGDRIAFTTQVIAKRPTSREGFGLVRSHNCGVNQHGETVFEFTASLFAPL